MDKVTAFDYPLENHVRRHGPHGYADYQSFRDWQRDEFSFRCVYCLKRELWGILSASFHIDHFQPQSHDPSGILDYDNLLYLCAACNALKSNQLLLDPCKLALGTCVRVQDDGSIIALNEEGQALIAKLRLDNKDHTRFRVLILETLKSFLRNNERELYVKWMSYPEELPDLSQKRPPGGNSRPEGIEQSCFARKQRGELPAVY